MQHKSHILFLGAEINLNYQTILEEIEKTSCLLITSLIFHFSLSCAIKKKRQRG